MAEKIPQSPSHVELEHDGLFGGRTVFIPVIDGLMSHHLVPGQSVKLALAMKF